MVSKSGSSKGRRKINSLMQQLASIGLWLTNLINQKVKQAWVYLISKSDRSTEVDGLFPALLGTFQDENIWVIDSGASRHMIGHPHQLKTLSNGKSSYSVELGDNKNYPVKGIGSTSIKLDNGSSIHLNNILYVLGLCKNLISISSLEEKGDRVAFINGKVVVWAKDSSLEKVRTIGVQEGRLYKLASPSNQALVHTEISPCELWHRRLGHLHFKILPTLNSIVNGIPNLKEKHEGICKGCALGKIANKTFGHSTSRAQEILDLIHSDVCGPTTKSLGEHLYYVTFIDDLSRKTWVYLLKSKDEVFSKFQEFKAEVENLTERKVKILTSNNGGEYTSKEIIVFCKEAGIKRELIVLYNPERNEVAKRKNGAIEESVKAMIHYQGLLKLLWGEATETVVYVQNRSPHRSLNNRTP